MEVDSGNFSKFAPQVFDGNNYHQWSVRMEAYLEALDLWDAGEKDFNITLPQNPSVTQIKALKEKKIKKSMAKTYLFSAVSTNIFTSIMSLKSAKEIWEYLKNKYAGDKKINGIKILNLIREFELQKMKDYEMIKDYSDRLVVIANNIRLLGSEFLESRIVQKILVTIPKRYETIIVTLENTKDRSDISLIELINALQAKDWSDISLVELINALQAQEQRKRMRSEEITKGALKAKIESLIGGNDNFPICPYCKKTNHQQTNCWWKHDTKCNRCGQLGHIARVCKAQQYENVKEATTLEQEDDILF